MFCRRGERSGSTLITSTSAGWGQWMEDDKRRRQGWGMLARPTQLGLFWRQAKVIRYQAWGGFLFNWACRISVKTRLSRPRTELEVGAWSERGLRGANSSSAKERVCQNLMSTFSSEQEPLATLCPWPQACHCLAGIFFSFQ